MTLIPENKKLVLFDGVCNLCNNSVTWIIKRDNNNVFLFAPLQSEIGTKIIDKFNIDTAKTDSILLFESSGRLSIKSSAALRIASGLGWPWKIMSVFLIIPGIIRNVVYDYIARNRYKWYGKKDACMIPTPELKSKFLD